MSGLDQFRFAIDYTENRTKLLKTILKFIISNVPCLKSTLTAAKLEQRFNEYLRKSNMDTDVLFDFPLHVTVVDLNEEYFGLTVAAPNSKNDTHYVCTKYAISFNTKGEIADYSASQMTIRV